MTFVKKKFNTIQTSKTVPLYHGVVNGPYYAASEVAYGLPKPAFLQPNLHEYTLVDGTSDLWTQSGSNASEYYYTGSNLTSKPSEVKIDGSYATEGTAGTLAELEWDWADNDSLGSNKLYVRLTGDADPDAQTEGYIEAQTGSDKVTVSPGDTRIDLVFPLGKNIDDELVFSKKYVMNPVDVTVSASGYVYAYLSSGEVAYGTTGNVAFTYSRTAPTSPSDGDIWFSIDANRYKQWDSGAGAWSDKDWVVLGKAGVGGNGYVYSVKSFFPHPGIANLDADQYSASENPWQFYDGVSFKTDGQFCAQQASQWVDDAAICEAVANNSIAMDAILANDTAIETVTKNKTSCSAIASSSLAQTKVSNKLSGMDKSYLRFLLNGLKAHGSDPSITATGDFIYDETKDVGIYGLTDSTDLIDGPTLASDIGLSAGTAFNDNAGWLKFFLGETSDPTTRHGTVSAKDRVVFEAKETLRYDLSWDDIYLAGAVYGTGDNGTVTASTGTSATQDAQTTIDGITYAVRVLTGSEADPATEAKDNQQCSDDAGGGSEWNDLLYRVHTDVPDCGDPTIGMPGGDETTRHGGPQDGDNWANYTNTGLQVYSADAGDGTYCHCQEQGNDTTRRVNRGGEGLADFDTAPADSTNSAYGWRPVLEVS